MTTSRFNTRFNRPQTDWFEQFQDFTTTGSYVATDYTITNTGSPTIAVSTSEIGGAVVFTTGATSGNNTFHDSKQLIWKFTPQSLAGTNVVQGKALEFEARLKISNVLDTDFVIGLQNTDTTPLAVTDGIWFGSDNGDALLDFHVAKGSAQTDLTGVTTLVNDTYFKVGFYYNGQDGDRMQVFLNDNRVGAVPVTNVSISALCLSIGIQTNSANARALTLDYFRIRQER